MQLETAFGGRAVLQGDEADIRQQFAGLFAAISPGYPAPSDALCVTDGSAQGVPYRIYYPVNAHSTTLLPIGVYMHGGGYILGDLDSEDILCRTFSEQTNSILISVGYRLAPEHKYPAQLKDSLTVFEWVRINVYLPSVNFI